jgi:hypothetical protein
MPSRTSVPLSPAPREALQRPTRAERRYRRLVGLALVVAGGWAAYPVFALALWLAKPGVRGAEVVLGLMGVLSVGLIFFAVDIVRPGRGSTGTTPLTVAIVLGSLHQGGQILFGLMAVAGDPVGFWRWVVPPIAQHPYSFGGIAAVPAFMMMASLLAAAMGRGQMAWRILMVALGMALSIGTIFPFGYFMRFAR